MAISAQVDYRPRTGRVVVTVDSDAGYNPDALDDIARRLIDTFTRVHATIETLEPTDDDGCDPEA